ncbi:hypothetical protein TNCV_5082911 [Trichonephila clavipes]|nr:hypothetical protein TNCV_5082911 [Trichonephila clavipes]
MWNLAVRSLIAIKCYVAYICKTCETSSISQKESDMFAELFFAKRETAIYNDKLSWCRNGTGGRSRTATAFSDVVQSGRPIFDDFFQHLWPYIGNNTANVGFQMVKRLWLIRIDQ